MFMWINISLVLAGLIAILSFHKFGSDIAKLEITSKMALEPIPRLSPGDPNSYSRPDQIQVTKIALELEVDFERHVLFGFATLNIQRHDTAAGSVILDTRDLNIKSVKDETDSSLSFTVDPVLGPFGSKLEISLKPSTTYIIIDYETSPNSTGLQWLNAQQTSGKTHPFLFSQFEAIHSRSAVPCQDTPSVKAPYTAKITAPQDMTVLMSAQRGIVEKRDDKKSVFHFDQPVPIPSYLIAFVAGKLDSRAIGVRSSVWAEPDVVEKAAYEFAETEDFLKAAEELAGPYVWGIYDIIVLPPSFPFGGMENPCLTFATPTLLAGDRSLANVIAHEIAHSWTGNLVTNANFEHFWLNEGFTVFLERKIDGRLYGEPHRQFAGLGGWKVLEEEVKTLGADHEFTKLIPDLTGSDPDDSFSSIPYEKGSVFLWYLSDLVGGEVFEKWLLAYVNEFKYKSIHTDDFKRHILEYFKDSGKLNDVDWELWLKGKGIPPYKPSYDNSLAEACDALRMRWVDWLKSGMTQPAPFSSMDLKDFSSVQIVEFLVQLVAENIPLEAVKEVQEAYDFNDNHNAEIRLRWLRLCLQGRWKEQVPLALEFATSQGRMKFVRPIFRDLYAWEDMRQAAIDAYYAHKDQWMYMTAYAVSKDLHLDGKTAELK